MKPLQLLAAFLGMGCAQATAQNSQNAPQPANAEQQAIMARIEREVRLPAGAAPLAAYARLYMWQQREDGVRKVIAWYENISGAPPGRRWVTEGEQPLIMDGGCGLVTISYNADTQRIEHVTCNGEG